MKTYNIVDNQGDVYASDIQSLSKARLILENIVKNIGEEEFNKLDIEII